MDAGSSTEYGVPAQIQCQTKLGLAPWAQWTEVASCVCAEYVMMMVLMDATTLSSVSNCEEAAAGAVGFSNANLAISRPARPGQARRPSATRGLDEVCMY